MANIALNKPSGGQLILSPEDGTSTETVTIPSDGVMKGAVVNTWSVVKNTRTVQSNGTNAWYNVSDMSLTIQPTYADSTLLVTLNINWAVGSVGSSASSAYLRILRDGVVDEGLNGNGDDVSTGSQNNNGTLGYSCFAQYRHVAGSSMHDYHMENSKFSNYIPANSTNQQTFQLQYRTQSNGMFRINGDSSFSEQTQGIHQPCGISSIIIQEVKA
jgi:hypothetical protein